MEKWGITVEKYTRYLEDPEIKCEIEEEEIVQDILKNLIKKYSYDIDKEFHSDIDTMKYHLFTKNGDGCDCVLSIFDLSNQKLIFTYSEGWIL
jgi:hypothetical protein